MILRAFWGRLALLLALVVASGALLWRPALAFYHLEAGGRDLAGAETFRSAQPAAGNQRLDLAVRHFQQAVALAPANGYAYRRLGQAWLLAGNNKSAQVALSRAAELRPHDPVVHIELGEAWSGLGEAEKAVAEYEQGRYGTALPDALVNYLKLADWRIAAGSGDLALKILQDKVLALDPHNLPALYRVAKIYAGMGQSGVAAAMPIRDQLKRFPIENIAVPASPALASELAQTMTALSEDGTWTQDTLRNVSGYQVWQFATGATGPAAEQLLQTLVTHWPQDADLLLDLGELYHRQGNYAAAEARYRQVLALAPGDARVALRLSMIAEARAGAAKQPAATAGEGSAATDLADRTAVAEALKRPASQIELGPNLLSSAAASEDVSVAAGWQYSTYPGPDENGGLLAHGIDDLVPGGRSARIDSLWRKPAELYAGSYAEQVSNSFTADPGRYLVTVRYALNRPGQGVGLCFWGVYDTPGGAMLLYVKLPDTQGSWSTAHFVVDGPAQPTRTQLLVRNWSEGSLMVTNVSVRRVAIAGD